MVKGKISSIINLRTTTALTAVKNEMPNVSNLVKKTDAKVIEIEKKTTDHDHDKHITTPEFNKLTAENFAARLAQANLASKSDIANFVKATDFDDILKNINELLEKIKILSTRLLFLTGQNV